MKVKPEKNSGLNGIQPNDNWNHDNCLSCVHNCYDQTWLHIILRSSNTRSFIYSLVFFTICRYITNSQSDQLPVGLIAQLVEHCTGIAELMGSNPKPLTAMINPVFTAQSDGHKWRNLRGFCFLVFRAGASRNGPQDSTCLSCSVHRVLRVHRGLLSVTDNITELCLQIMLER